MEEQNSYVLTNDNSVYKEPAALWKAFATRYCSNKILCAEHFNGCPHQYATSEYRIREWQYTHVWNKTNDNLYPRGRCSVSL